MISACQEISFIMQLIAIIYNHNIANNHIVSVPLAHDAQYEVNQSTDVQIVWNTDPHKMLQEEPHVPKSKEKPAVKKQIVINIQ